MPITGENFIAIGQEKKNNLKTNENNGIAYEKLYGNTLMNSAVLVMSGMKPLLNLIAAKTA